VFRIGGNTFYNRKNKIPMKIPELKRSGIGLIAEFRGIPNGFPNLADIPHPTADDQLECIILQHRDRPAHGGTRRRLCWKNIRRCSRGTTRRHDFDRRDSRGNVRRDRRRCGRGRHNHRTRRRETPGWHGTQIICRITAPKACWLWRWKLEKFSLRMWQDFCGCVRLPRYAETPRLSFLPSRENNDGEEKTGRTGTKCKCGVQPWDWPTIDRNRKGEDDPCVLCSLEMQKKEVCKREGCNQFAQNVVRMGIACITHDASAEGNIQS
jgi:hypothetical protein